MMVGGDLDHDRVGDRDRCDTVEGVNCEYDEDRLGVGG